MVITGAVREDDRIVAVALRPIFRSARELGAFYRAALAEELVREGYAIEQGTGKDGRYFEIAGVPRELCEAFSGRSREVARAAERFRARYGRAPDEASCATSRSKPQGQDAGHTLRPTASVGTDRARSRVRPG